MWRTTKLLILALALLLAFGQAAQAALSQVGPIAPGSIWQGNPNTGFPSFYADSNGTSLALLPITGDGVNPPTQIYFPPNPANPYSVQLGFDAEAFYWFGRCIFNTKDGRATATFGLEASFVNGVAVPGEEMVFARIRLRAPVRTLGFYTFKHPWGTETIEVTDAKKGINFTRDIGLVPRDFTGALNGPIGPFLTQDNPPPPPGWVGDGASVGTVTGSPTGFNAVTLTAPAGVDLDGRKNNFVTSNQFTVSGRIAAAIPAFLNVDRVTCSYINTVENIDLFLTSTQFARIRVYDTTGFVDPATSTPIFVGTVADASGKFYQSFPSTLRSINVVADDPNSTTSTPTIKTEIVKDYVNILKAEYSLGSGTLTIEATSSDWIKHPGTPPVLTANGFGGTLNLGPLTFNILGVASLTVPVTGAVPPTINVTSSVLGSDTTPTAIVP